MTWGDPVHPVLVLRAGREAMESYCCSSWNVWVAGRRGAVLEDALYAHPS